MARVFNRERTWLDPVLRPVERLIYRLTGVDEKREMRWTEYAVGDAAVQRGLDAGALRDAAAAARAAVQSAGLPGVPPALAFNTAVSFTTNTNWQAYGGETTMSYLTQMAGLAYHNFVSAAVGIALAIAFIRGIAQQRKGDDRQLLGGHGAGVAVGAAAVLIVGALFLVSQGVVQNLRPYDAVKTRRRRRAQTIAQGPVASQEIIKQFGTNGGGFFNANSAHPFENPTPLTNFLAMFAIFAISSGLTYTLGDDDRLARGTAGRSGRPWRFCSWPASRSRTGPRRAATRC